MSWTEDHTRLGQLHTRCDEVMELAMDCAERDLLTPLEMAFVGSTHEMVRQIEMDHAGNFPGDDKD